MTTIMQPFHCDLQPQIQDTHRTTHTGTTARCRGGTHSRLKRPQPHPPHTRGTFHRRPQPLYTEKHKLSCSCFLPNTHPMQHSCSHYNAFCRITSQTCTDLRTWQHQMTTIMQPFHCDLQPQLQDTHRTTHTGTTTRCRTQFPKSPHSLCHRLPSSPLPLVTTSQSHHTPFVTASQSHLVPRSTLPFVTTTPSSPTFLPHHFPKSPFP